MIAFGSRINRITAIIETVFPEPDSPTMPDDVVVLDRQREAVDRAHEPVLRPERHVQVADLRAAAQARRTRGSSHA